MYRKAATIWKGSLLVLFALILFPHGSTGTEENEEVIDRIRANSFSVAPSASISLDQASQTIDSRAAEIAAKLREKISAIRARKDSAQAAPQLSPRRKEALERLRERLSNVNKVRMRSKTGTPRQIKGKKLHRAVRNAVSAKERDRKTARAFLRSYRDLLRLRDPDSELKLYRMDRDRLGRRHLRFSQMYRGLPVWPAELIVHLDPEGDVDLMSGGHVPTPRRLITTPALDATVAIARARDEVPGGEGAEVSDPTLIIYAPVDRRPRLAWKLEVNVSLESHWLVVIDAMTGDKLDAYNQVMEANVAGSGVDLFDATKPLNVWEEDGTFFMVDTSKQMFDPTSDPPNRTTTHGGIVILDALNQEREGTITLFKVASTSSTSGWLPDAVSVAFNLSETYDYFLERHGRDSIDGEGGTITGVVRLGFDGAFWNGELMAFGTVRKFAGALDIVGHEMTHGVTQATANLAYKNQSGALSEAMSDIFGEMIEARTKGSPDWLVGAQLGEPLRSLIDPSSIEIIPGSGLVYPEKMSEFIGPSDPILDNFKNRDNGGVHINSSIINHAFYLLAEGLDGAIGLRDAELIFYRTLTTHLMGDQNLSMPDLALLFPLKSYLVLALFRPKRQPRPLTPWRSLIRLRHLSRRPFQR